MNKEEVMKMISTRLKNEPEFKSAYDAYLAKAKAEGRLSDKELTDVSGGFIGFETCPVCKEYTLTTYTFGIYAVCSECGYSEWFI